MGFEPEVCEQLANLFTAVLTGVSEGRSEEAIMRSLRRDSELYLASHCGRRDGVTRNLAVAQQQLLCPWAFQSLLSTFRS